MVRALMRSIFGKNAGRFLLLDEDAAHAALAEIDRKREPGGPGAYDQNVTVHHAPNVLLRPPPVAAQLTSAAFPVPTR